MSDSKSFSYYLSALASSDKVVCFRAVFCDSCAIKSCFIIASSLHQAIQVLYNELLPVWGKSYLDNYLIEIRFYSTIPFYL